MQILRNWSAVYGSALLALFTVGCGNVTQLADKANQEAANAQAAEEGEGSSSSSGGSLALTTDGVADASAKTIIVKVQKSLECAEGPRGKGHGPRHDRRPPPPRRGKMPPPPPRDGREPEQDQDGAEFKLQAEGEDQDAVTSEGEGEMGRHEGDRHEGGRPDDCVVAESKSDLADAALQLDGIAVGKYYVIVVLEDENGKAVQQGMAEVEIKVGEVSAAEITLEPIQEGSVSVTIKQAAEEEAATEETATNEEEAVAEEVAIEEIAE